MLPIIIFILVIIIFSGIFSGTEAAIISVTPAEVETMVQKKKLGSKFVAMATSNLSRSVTTVLILNNIVNIAGSVLVGRMVISIYGDAALGIVTAGLTFGIIVFAEIIPKSLATRYARTASLLVAPWVVAITTLFMPIIFPLEKILGIFGKGERKFGTESQIRSLVRLGRRKGYIEQDEGQLIHRVFHLNDVSTGTLMTNKDDIIAFRASTTVKDAITDLIADRHSRFPVFGKDLDDIQGIILETEVLAAASQGNDDQPLSNFSRRALFVNDDMTADDLLILFRNEHAHMAIVQKKGKFTIGLVTLEDVLEELVGEIEDERDQQKQ